MLIAYIYPWNNLRYHLVRGDVQCKVKQLVLPADKIVFHFVE